ncbi:MAG: OsmC family protein [Deltaproteobacteria bacterium]|nr:OsmC family protein [Deltaproteobacteria bacterium]
MSKIKVNLKEELRADITVGPHRLIADESKENGGTDAGPNPYSYLVSALGACTAMTLKMYAKHKSWPLKEVTVELEHSKVEGKDHISRRMTLTGDLSEEQITRLKEIAQKCPLYKTLTTGTVIEDL